MIMLGVSPRRMPAVASMVLDGLAGHGPLQVIDEGGGVYIWTRDGSEVSAWIPLWEPGAPAATAEGVLNWLTDAGFDCALTAADKRLGYPLGRIPATPAPPAAPAGQQLGFGF